MTTCAADYRTRTIAADTRVQTEGTWWPGEKIYRVPQGLFAGAGDATEINRYLAWLRKGQKGPRPKAKSFEGLLMTEEGLFLIDSDGDTHRIERGWHAIGSGTHAALAAMMMGADPRRAVEVAAAIDTGTGGEISVASL